MDKWVAIQYKKEKRLGQVLCAMLIFNAHNERTFYICYALMNEIQVLTKEKKLNLLRSIVSLVLSVGKLVHWDLQKLLDLKLPPA